MSYSTQVPLLAGLIEFRMIELSQKPCWRPYRILCWLKCLVRVETTMCSVVLQSVQMSEIGWWLAGSFCCLSWKEDILGPSSDQLVLYHCRKMPDKSELLQVGISGIIPFKTVGDVEILISCIVGNLHCRCSGKRLTRKVAPFILVVWQSFISSRGALIEETDCYCGFRRYAWSTSFVHTLSHFLNRKIPKEFLPIKGPMFLSWLPIQAKDI